VLPLDVEGLNSRRGIKRSATICVTLTTILYLKAEGASGNFATVRLYNTKYVYGYGVLRM
jgi:hypothetical protein